MVKLIGIPFDANSSFMRGPAQAPARIRQMDTDGSANRCTERGVEIVPGSTFDDVGDISFVSNEPQKAFEAIKSNISSLLREDNRILSLGGDHSISYPIIAAYVEKYDDLHILHIDAHGDLYDHFDKNPYSHASPFARIMELGKIASLTQVGIRTLNDHQRKQVDKFDVHMIEMKDFEQATLFLRGPLYISLDIDALDPAYAPGVSHHEPGGLTTRQLLELLHAIEVPVVGADIVECNPARDINNMTAMVGYKLMKELIELML